ncbi:MAG TPA: hypothetical protein VGB76_11765 [Pyrinomonadaceae bacterium]
MISDHEWRGVPLERVAEWRAVFQSSREGLDLSAPCPLCGVKALRRWYQVNRPEEMVIDGVRYVGRGGLWEWCGDCLRYEHYSARVPEWWACDLEVDERRLTALPTAIEEAIRLRGQIR